MDTETECNNAYSGLMLRIGELLGHLSRTSDDVDAINDLKLTYDEYKQMLAEINNYPANAYQRIIILDRAMSNR